MNMISSEESGLSVVGDICVKDKSSNRDAILKYEDYAKDLPQVDIPVIHHMHGGMYGREITIPKGTVLTGMIYKFDHFDIMISGDITVSTDDAQVIRMKGFNLFKGLSADKPSNNTGGITMPLVVSDDTPPAINLPAASNLC